MTEAMKMFIGYGVLVFFAGHLIGAVWSAVASIIRGATGRTED